MIKMFVHLWSDHDISLLKKGYNEFGNNWSMIAEQYLPHISQGALKNKFYRIGYKIPKGHKKTQKRNEQSDKEDIWDQIIRIICQ